MGGHSENPQAPFLSLNLSTAGPAPEAAQEIRASSPCPPCPLSCSCVWQAAPAANPSTGLARLDEGARGNYVSRAFQAHDFPKHMDIWGKEQLVT